MKLNPPASSSDLEVARAVARRLHQKSFGATASGPEAAEPPREEVAPPRRPAPPPPEPVRRPAPPPLPPRPAPPPAPLPAPPEPRLELDSAVPSDEEAWTEPPPRRAKWVEEPPPRVARPGPPPVREPWVEPPPARGDLPEIAEDEEDIEVEAPEEPVFDAPGIGAPGLDEADVEEPVLDEPSFDETSIGADGEDDALAGLTGPEPSRPAMEAPSFDEPEIEVPDDGPSIGAGEPSVADEALPYEEPPPGVSPDDLIGGPDTAETWEDESGLEAEIEAAVDGDTSPEDLIEVATPAWDDVAATCLSLAGGRGAMLVDASGQVLAAQGDWPNPGPEAIAGRLVTMMDRALRDAPTRSVSAPLAGQHLTAWRVPLAESLVTAVFIGDAPLKADVRPPIDDEIRRAGGA